jgi:hypothetical protein
MKKLTPDRYREGMRVTCIIENREITDAKLHYENSYWYICQNEKFGSICLNKLGYKNSWIVSSKDLQNSEDWQTTDLREAFTLKDKIKELFK